MGSETSARGLLSHRLPRDLARGRPGLILGPSVSGATGLTPARQAARGRLGRAALGPGLRCQPLPTLGG